MIERAEKPTHWRFVDIEGQKFGRWTVVGYAGATPSRNQYWWCECECGSPPKKVSSANLNRIDPDGDYEPGNCRWATWDVQIANRRPRCPA